MRVFTVACGVHRVGVLLPYPFTVYVNDPIVTGNRIMVSMLVSYSLDVLFMLMTLQLHCHLLRVTDCKNLFMPAHIMGRKWDIKFKPLKSQLIAFGGHNPSCVISLNGNPIPWVTKVKYLDLQFLCNSVITDVSEICV